MKNMKTPVVHALALALAAILDASALAQGIIQFQNLDPAAGIDVPVYWAFPDVKVDGSDPLFRAVLLGGPKGSIEATPGAYVGQLNMLASPTTGVTWVGFLSGPDAGYLNVGTDAARVIPGVDWGQEAIVQVAAWHGNYTTWEEAFYATQSDPNLKVATSAPLMVQFPEVPSNNVKLGGLRIFDFVIPEPSTFSLLVVFGVVYRAHKRRRLM